MSKKENSECVVCGVSLQGTGKLFYCGNECAHKAFLENHPEYIGVPPEEYIPEVVPLRQDDGKGNATLG